MLNALQITVNWRNDQRIQRFSGDVVFAAFDLALPAAPLGYLVLAATDQGLCVLSFADHAQQARQIVALMMPMAQLRCDNGMLRPYADQVMPMLSVQDEGKPDTGITLDVFGTVFQQQVWRGLMAIRRGEILTYGTFAQRLGVPKAVRAVGTACGANAISLLIPCHRVMGKNGSLTGFRWGVIRKQWLIQHETGQANSQEILPF